MFGESRKKRAAKKLKPGDGKPLKPFRWWHLLSRTLFHLQVPAIAESSDTPCSGLQDSDARNGRTGSGHTGRTSNGPLESDTVTYAVNVDYLAGDWDFEAHLYRDGVQHTVSAMPAVFPIEGGEIRVAMGVAGLKRCHFYPDTGSPHQLEPDPGSAEGYRALLKQRHPRVSRALGVASFTVLVVALLLGLPQMVELVTSLEIVSQFTGTFESPLQLPGWANTALIVASLVAMCERALRLRYNALLDGGDLDFGS